MTVPANTPLKAFRRNNGLKLRDLAEQIGVTEGQMSRIERNGTNSLSTALRIANVTGLPVAALEAKRAA